MSPEIAAAITADLRAGARQADVVKLYGISRSLAERYARRANVPKKDPPLAWTDAERDLLHSLRGRPLRAVAKALGRSYGAVQSELTRNPEWKRPSTVIQMTVARRLASHRRANIMHLVDLKRAGHSPRQTELRIPNEESCPPAWRPLISMSFTGSQAALCADF